MNISFHIGESFKGGLDNNNSIFSVSNMWTTSQPYKRLVRAEPTASRLVVGK